jgi:hypothetical protein
MSWEEHVNCQRRLAIPGFISSVTLSQANQVENVLIFNAL